MPDPVPPGSTIASWLTPLPRELTADLIMSLPNSMDTHDHTIRDLVPNPAGGLVTVPDALNRSRNSQLDEHATNDPLRRVTTDPDWSR